MTDGFGTTPSTPQKEVGFPEVGPSKSKFPKWLPILLIFVTIIVLIVAAWFILQPPKEGGTLTPTPTPALGGETFSVPTPTPTPTIQPKKPSIQRSEVTIEILNGTGIPKEASFLEGELKNMGYSEIETANAQKQNYTATEVTFDSDLPEEVRTEIIQKLQDLYNKVEVKEYDKEKGKDIRIITGVRKSASNLPTATHSPSPTPTL